MQSPSGFGNTDNSWWSPFPHLPKLLRTEDPGLGAGNEGLVSLGHALAQHVTSETGEGHPVPGVQQLQTQPANTPSYFIQLQGQPSTGHLEKGFNNSDCSWMRACTGTENAHPSPTVNTTLVFPWIGPENKAKDSSPEASRAQPWLRPVVWPHADVCSCLSSTWTSSALGWELLPKFCQGCRLERLGSGHCTDPALLAISAFQVPTPT